MCCLFVVFWGGASFAAYLFCSCVVCCLLGIVCGLCLLFVNC